MIKLTLTNKEIEKIYNHLLKTNQGFCFYNGGIVSMEDCENVLKIDSNKRHKNS